MQVNLDYQNSLNRAFRMDDPLTKGPLPRWQRRALEESNSSLNSSVRSNQSLHKITLCKTPNSSQKKSSSKKSSNGKSPARSKTPKSPYNTGSDIRFIPNRSTTQFEMAYYKLMKLDALKIGNSTSPSKLENQRIITENLNGIDIENTKILSYNKKFPSAPEGHINALKVIYIQNKTPASRSKISRYIPSVSDRILDAPHMSDDYYLNLLDWSYTNYLAVALHGAVYLWNAGTAKILKLLEMEESDQYISSVNWDPDGHFLAVGTSNNDVQIWDLETRQKLRSLWGHAGRVGSLSWNNHILSSGSRTGIILHHDVRIYEHTIAKLEGHSQEVCGLKWSPDGRYLASGANDNTVLIWPTALNQNSTNKPLHRFQQHTAAVKGVSWCPWKTHILATGGGTADRCIKIWNIHTGLCLNSVDTNSQVCAILWSTEYEELISGHGYADNQLILWKYPAMTHLTELSGHTARVLHLALSPDGTTVVSAAADETLRLWKCFAVDPKMKKVKNTISKTEHNLPKGLIR